MTNYFYPKKQGQHYNPFSRCGRSDGGLPTATAVQTGKAAGVICGGGEKQAGDMTNTNKKNNERHGK